MNVITPVLKQEVFEYMLVLSLPASLQQRVEREKFDLCEQYKIQQPKTGRPNVSLARFKAAKFTEQKMMRRFSAIAMELKPFKVELNNYDGYPMHAVYIKIENQQAVLELIKNLKQVKPLMKGVGDEPYFLVDPQIALAGRLEPDTYMDVMKAYQHKKFKESFMADAILLLRKNETNYTMVKDFKLKGSAQKRKQAALF